MGKMLTGDLGDGIIGFITEVDESTVCVATPRIFHDPSARRAMRALVQDQGGDCANCGGCPIGQMDS